MFPGAGAQVYYNEAGEPLGWDYPEQDYNPDPDEFYLNQDYDEPDNWCKACGEEHDSTACPKDDDLELSEHDDS